MTGFLLKKFFYDLWDNLFSILFLNLLCWILLLALFFLPPLVASLFPAANIILFAALVFCLCVYICAAAKVLSAVSDYGRIRIGMLLATLKAAIPPAAVLCAADMVLAWIVRVTVPLYLHMGGFAGYTAALFSLWVCLFSIAALQFYPALYYRMNTSPFASLKKCALFFLDNTLFCLCMLVQNILLSALIVSIPLFQLLYLDEGMRLRLYKYDWLVAEHSNGSKRRPNIPWETLLAADKEKTGERSIQSFIFPWRD